MKYFIGWREVDSQTFEKELAEKLKTYVQVSEYYPTKEQFREELFKKGHATICYKKENGHKEYLDFVVVEDDVAKMAEIIGQNEYDPLDNDQICIAKALYDAGCRFVKGDDSTWTT